MISRPAATASSSETFIVSKLSLRFRAFHSLIEGSSILTVRREERRKRGPTSCHESHKTCACAPSPSKTCTAVPQVIRASSLPLLLPGFLISSCFHSKGPSKQARTLKHLARHSEQSNRLAFPCTFACSIVGANREPRHRKLSRNCGKRGAADSFIVCTVTVS